jgi:hypothetical protein
MLSMIWRIIDGIDKNRLEKIVSIIGILTTFSGGGYAIHEYFESKADDKIRESFQFIERMTSNPIQERWYKLNKKSYDKQLEEIMNGKNVSENEEIANKATKRVLEIVHENEMETDILLMIDFFSMIQICIEHEICDQEIVKIFIGEDVKRFYNSYLAFILFARDEYEEPHLANKVEDFLQTFSTKS